MSVIQIKQKSASVFELPDGSIAYTMKKHVKSTRKLNEQNTQLMI